MYPYSELLNTVLQYGEETTDRTGTGTISLFGAQLEFDQRDGFPAVTTKKLAFKSMIAELLWFIRGSDNLCDLRALTHGEEHRFNPNKRTIWDDNYNTQGKQLGYTDGFCGLVYGTQWRAYGLSGANVSDAWHGRDYFCELPKVDQLKELIEEAKSNPDSRRLLLQAWNPQLVWKHSDDQIDQYEIFKPILPPCHTGFQIKIYGDYLDMLWTQRSCDVFLGLPFNIASYAALQHILCRILNKKPRRLVGQIGDAHIYKNHVDQVNEQLDRSPYALPELWINPSLKTLEDFEKATIDDFQLGGYQHHGPIKAPMAV